jgi:hypothetical protein
VPCDSVYTTTTKLQAANLKLLALAAREAFSLTAPPDVLDGTLAFTLPAASAQVTISRGLVSVRARYGQTTAEAVTRELTLAYGRVVTRDVARRIGWKVEADRNDPNVLTLVRE